MKQTAEQSAGYKWQSIESSKSTFKRTEVEHQILTMEASIVSWEGNYIQSALNCNVSEGPGPRLSLKTEEAMATTKLTLTQHTFKICLYYLTLWWQMCMCVFLCICLCGGRVTTAEVIYLRSLCGS